MQTKSSALLGWLLLLPLLALTYYPAFPGPFLLDDHSAIVENSEIRYLTPQNILSLFRSHADVRALDHHPVPALTFLLDYQWAELEPWAYRVTNLFLHWLTAGAALLLTTTVFSWLGLDIFAALAVVYLWALHPFGSMPVGYITCRQETLMALGCLSSLIFLSRGREVPSLLAAVAAFLSKEVAVTLPFALFAFEWIQSGSSFWATFRRRPRYFAALTIAWGFLCYWHLKGGRRQQLGAPEMPLASVWEYFKAECAILVDYFAKLFYPVKLQFYPWASRVESWQAWLPHAVLLALLFALGAYLLWRGPRWAGFALLWPFFILGPTSSFIPIPYEPAMEYRMYLPALPLLALLVHLAHRWAPRRVVLSAAALAAVALGTVSHLRARDYASSIALYSQQISVDPRALFAWDSLAGAYYRAEEYDKARQAAWKTIDLALVEKAPEFLARSYYTLALVESEKRQDDIAIDYLRRSIAAANNLSAKVVLAALLLRRGETLEPLALAQSVLTFTPDRADALFLLYEIRMKENNLTAAGEILDRIARFHPSHSQLADQQTRLLRRRSGATDR